MQITHVISDGLDESVQMYSLVRAFTDRKVNVEIQVKVQGKFEVPSSFSYM